MAEWAMHRRSPNEMSRRRFLEGGVAAGGVALLAGYGAPPIESDLNVYNWADYISPVNMIWEEFKGAIPV